MNCAKKPVAAVVQASVASNEAQVRDRRTHNLRQPVGGLPRPQIVDESSSKSNPKTEQLMASECQAEGVASERQAEGAPKAVPQPRHPRGGYSQGGQ